MTKKTKIGILSLAVLLLVVLCYFLFSSDEEKKVEKKDTSKELYNQMLSADGLNILYQLVKEYPKVDSIRFVRDGLEDNLSTKTNGGKPNVYVLIDRDIDLSPKSIDTLFEFVNKGNHAMISVEYFDYVFTSRITYSDLTSNVYSEGASLDFTNPKIKMYLPYLLKKYNHNLAEFRYWNYFELSDFFMNTDKITTLGVETYYDNPNFIKFPYGDGYFYLHTVPQAFYNESMFTEDGFDYSQRVFSHLPKGNYIWHRHTEKWNNKKAKTPDSMDRESPIQLILKDKYLRHSYLVLLFGLLLYIAFKIKRRQRIIPTVEPNENSSLEFVETVSLLYLKQNKHYKFIKHYEQSFVHFIKDKYYISTNNIDKNFIELVAAKSDIEENRITEIFSKFNEAKKSYEYSTDKLIALHKKIEYFYKNCK